MSGPHYLLRPCKFRIRLVDVRHGLVLVGSLFRSASAEFTRRSRTRLTPRSVQGRPNGLC